MRNISALKIIQKLASIAEPQTPDSEEHEFMNACARSEQLHSYINDSSTHSDTHTHEHIKHQINSKRNALSSIKSVETARTHKIAIYSYVDGARCFFLFFVLFCFLFYFHFFIIFSWHPMVWKRTYTWSHLPVPVSVHNQQYVHQNEVENHHLFNINTIPLLLPPLLPPPPPITWKHEFMFYLFTLLDYILILFLLTFLYRKLCASVCIQTATITFVCVRAQ